MGALGLTLALYLTPTLAFATPAGEDAFHGFARVRKLERQVALVSEDPSLLPANRHELARLLSADLTEARIGFYSVLRSDGAQLDPDEDQLLSRVVSGRPTGLGGFNQDRFLYLRETFPEAAKFSPLEWKLLGEWFGPENRTAFLHWIFRAEELNPSPGGHPRRARLLLVGKSAKAAARLRHAGHEVELAALDSRAAPGVNEDSLWKTLRARRSTPTFVVTEGTDAAIFRRTLERHPGLRSHRGIAGWLNVNGALFGAGERWENLERPAPLGEGFPILNLVSKENAGNREALAAEGQTLLLPKASPWPHLGQALRHVAVPFAAR